MSRSMRVRSVSAPENVGNLLAGCLGLGSLGNFRRRRVGLDGHSQDRGQDGQGEHDAASEVHGGFSKWCAW